MKKLDVLTLTRVIKTTNTRIMFSIIFLIAGMSIASNTAWADDDHAPFWTKKLSDWWSQGNISDAESVNAFRYLIDNNIIHISGLSFNHTISFDKQVQQTRMYSSFLWNESRTSDFKPNTDVYPNSRLYTIFVQAAPPWAPYATALVPNATNYWENASNSKFIYSKPGEAAITIRWLKEPDSKYVGYDVDRMTEVALGDSKCDGVWHAYDTDFVTSILKHELGHALGFGHSANMGDIMYPIISGEKYSQIKENFTLSSNRPVFVHVCTSSHTSTFHYGIKSNDPKGILDMFFVPSKIEYDKFVNSKKFDHYNGTGCFGVARTSYDDICSNVSNEGGLIIRQSNDLSTPKNVTLILEEE